MRRMAQTAEKETDGPARLGRDGRQAIRGRLKNLAGQPQSEAALQIRVMKRAPEWRHNKMEAAAGHAQDAYDWRQYAGNGSYSNTRLAASRELSSCAPKSQ